MIRLKKVFFISQLFLLLFPIHEKQNLAFCSDLEQEYFELFMQAENFRLNGDFDKSIKFFEISLDNAKKIPNRKAECEILAKLGLLYWNIGQLKESSSYYEQAFGLSKKLSLKDLQEKCIRAVEIYRLYEEGKKYRDLGKYQNSIDSFNNAIDLARKGESKEHEVKCLRQLSLTYLELNNLNEFYLLNSNGLNIAQILNHEKEKAKCLINIGIYYTKLDSYSKALHCYETALKIARDIKIKEDIPGCLSNIGEILVKIGNYDKALEYLMEALEIDQQSGDDKYILSDSNNIGETYRRKGLTFGDLTDFDKALYYFKKCLEITNRIKDKKMEVYVLNNMGSVYSELSAYSDQKKYSEGMEYFKLALKEAEGIQDIEAIGTILNNIGIVYYNQGDYEKSAEYYDKVIKLNFETGGGNILWETFLYNGNNYAKQNKLFDALQSYKESIKFIETFRYQINLEELKAKYLGTDKRIDVYYNLIHILATLSKSHPEEKYDLEAFDCLEKAKARAFLESIELSQIDTSQGVDRELLDREKELMKDYSMLQTKLLIAGLDSEEKDKIFKRLNEKEDEIEICRMEIRLKSPAYASVNPKIITLREAQEMLPNKNAAYIAYSIGKEHSYAFVITKKQLKIFPLPARDEIKKQVREFLTVISNKESHNFENGYRLYKMLVSPGLDENIKTIIFIPDDILNFLPFETLVADSEKEEWLIKKYDVSYAPSITSLREIIQRKKEKRPSKHILAFGDPFFGSLEREGNGNDAIKEFYSLSSDISRLRFSGSEIDTIRSVFKKANLFRREDATEDRLKKQNLEDYRIIHFATHSIIDDKIPSRSSIVLSLDEDPNEDGFLRMDEIYSLKLNSDLVTLSACETGLGEFIHGEGIVGINRAFYYAGTSAVLMSLWAVNDQASYQLMERFYRHLRSSESIVDALRKVKLEMINSQALSHPYYWAGFIVSGKADEIVFPRSINRFILFGISFLILIGIILATMKSIKKRA